MQQLAACCHKQACIIAAMLLQAMAAARHADVLTLIESHLFEKRLDALLMPSTQPVDGPIGSGFGFRSDPFTGRPALHTGLDFPADPGTPIVAAAGASAVCVGGVAGVAGEAAIAAAGISTESKATNRFLRMERLR